MAEQEKDEMLEDFKKSLRAYTGIDPDRVQLTPEQQKNKEHFLEEFKKHGFKAKL